MTAILEPVDSAVSRIQIHKKFKFLLEPHRYKVAYGGRGGLKSWQYARALLFHAAVSSKRILCTREVQKSLKDSVHQLLSDQIAQLNLGHLFDVVENEIRGPHGSLFLFAGLSDQTAESMKSFEGVDIVWVEEARVVTKRSWSILIPTIRKPGSEIWVSFNPELDTDETYIRFVLNPPEDCVTVYTTWRDNPWLSHELEQERRHCLATESREEYEHIWEGKCRPAESGAIFADEVALMTKEQRIGPVPYDPRLRVHTIWDFGFDTMAVILAQRRLSECRMIDYLEEHHKTIDDLCAILAAKRYNWGFDFLPHDGYSRDHKSGKTVEDILKAFGRRPQPVNRAKPEQPIGTVEQGIRAARVLLRQTYADRQKCARLIECWKRYKRHIPKHGEPSTPIHDEFSHGADATRYTAYVVERMTNQIDEDERPISVIPAGAYDKQLGGLG